MGKVAAHDYRKKPEYTQELVIELWEKLEHNSNGGVPHVFYDYEVEPLLNRIIELEEKLDIPFGR